MAGAIGMRLECPRCGRTVPSWQPVHIRCFVYRVRAIVWMLAAAVVLPSGLYGFRWASVQYDRWRATASAARNLAVQQAPTVNQQSGNRPEAAPARPGSKLQAAPPSAVAAIPPQEAKPLPAPSRGSGVAAEMPTVRVGDRWVLRSDDLNNPKWSNVTERIVLEASDNQLVVTSRNTQTNYTRTLVFSRDWNLIQSREPDGRGYKYSPPLKYFDFPLFPGKKWEAEIEEAPLGARPTRKHQLSAVVEGWEDVIVPAGTFRALKIVLRVKALEESVVVRDSEDVSWYAPKAKRSVKTAETSFNHSSGLRTMRTVSLIELAVSE